MDFFFWLLLNLAAPIVGPVFTLALVAVTHGYAVARQLIVESVKDGQLLWSAIALSASATYEAVAALEARGAVPVLEFCIAVFGATAFACSVIVMTATIKACTEGLIEQSRSKRVQRKVTSAPVGLVAVSIGLTGFVAVAYTTMHVYFL
jgi:hypothetical protein